MHIQHEKQLKIFGILLFFLIAVNASHKNADKTRKNLGRLLEKSKKPSVFFLIDNYKKDRDRKSHDTTNGLGYYIHYKQTKSPNRNEKPHISIYEIKKHRIADYLRPNKNDDDTLESSEHNAPKYYRSQEWDRTLESTETKPKRYYRSQHRDKTLESDETNRPKRYYRSEHRDKTLENGEQDTSKRNHRRSKRDVFFDIHNHDKTLESEENVSSKRYGSGQHDKTLESGENAAPRRYFRDSHHDMTLESEEHNAPKRYYREIHHDKTLESEEQNAPKLYHRENDLDKTLETVEHKGPQRYYGSSHRDKTLESLEDIFSKYDIEFILDSREDVDLPYKMDLRTPFVDEIDRARSDATVELSYLERPQKYTDVSIESDLEEVVKPPAEKAYLLYSILRQGGSPNLDPKTKQKLEDSKKNLREVLRSRCSKYEACLDRCKKLRGRGSGCEFNCQKVFDALNACQDVKNSCEEKKDSCEVEEDACEEKDPCADSCETEKPKRAKTGRTMPPTWCKQRW